MHYNVWSQDILPSFNAANQIYHHITPDHSDNEGLGTVGLSYKSQWQGLADQIGFNTIQINGESHLYASNLDQWTAGGVFLHDNGSTGSLQNNVIQLHGRYQRMIPISKKENQSLTVQVGTGIRFGGYNINPSTLWFGRQFDIPNNVVNTNLVSGESNIIDNVNYWSFMFSASGTYTIKKRHKLLLGLTVTNLNTPKISLMNSNEFLPRSYFGTMQFKSFINKQLIQDIQIAYQHIGSFQNILMAYKMHFNVNADDSNIYVGLGSRLGKSYENWQTNTIAFLFGVEFNMIDIQFNYERSVSPFSANSNGGSTFELMASYRIRSN